jgi:hypothetical protein
MKKIAIFTTMLLIISVMSISATETRVLTMGDNNMLLLDEANIFLFPSRISDWPNLVTGEFGNDDFAKLGIHWKFGTKEKPWYLATYFHNNSPELPGMWYNPFFNMFGYGQSSLYVDFDDPTFLASNKRMDLVYGRKLGENMFGVHFGMVHSSRRNNDIVPGYVGANNDSKDDESLGIYKLIPRRLTTKRSPRVTVKSASWLAASTSTARPTPSSVISASCTASTRRSTTIRTRPI